MLPVVGKLADGFADVIQRQMCALFRETFQHVWLPAFYQFLDATDIDIAVMKIRFKLGHVSHHEASVLANAVAAHGAFASVHPGCEKFKGESAGIAQTMLTVAHSGHQA